jgi:hypothetical protein
VVEHARVAAREVGGTSLRQRQLEREQLPLQARQVGIASVGHRRRITGAPSCQPAPPVRRHDRAFPAHADVLAAAPADVSTLELIVRRPARDQREVLAAARLDPVEGLVGDGWLPRGSKSTPDGSADPLSQLTVMSTRVLAAIEPDRARWPLAGDQLYADLDLSTANLPPVARLRIGEALVQVTERPHTGCAKFASRYGLDALRWISEPAGRAARMRGMYVRVLEGGAISVGDVIRKA